MTLEYDAETAPEPNQWLRADEDERREAVLDYHKSLDIHPEARSMEAHAGIHAAVETQLALDDPLVVREKMNALLDAGIDRHAAIHALAVPVSHVAYGVVDEDEFDDDTDIMAAKLAEVTVEDGREQEQTWERARRESRGGRSRKQRPDPDAIRRSNRTSSDDD